MHKFIHFGCWNKGGSFLNSKTEKTSNLTNVMRLLKIICKDENEERPEFISIAGDNYYPMKVENELGKNKIFNKNELKSGFDDLPKDIPINVIMGNHDYEKELNMYEFTDQGVIIRNINSCEILDTEYEIKKNNENIDILFYKYFSFTDKTKILMIDTTIYSDDDMNNIDCYLKHPNIKQNIDEGPISPESIRNMQSEFIINQITQTENDSLTLKDGDNLVIIGHHPISCFKYKKNKEKQEYEMMQMSSPGEKFIETLYTIYTTLKSKNINYYYLCADLHQYQIGNILIEPTIRTSPEDRMFIKQYIVGTGGADLDPYYPHLINQTDLNHKIEGNYKVYYYMTEEEIAKSDSTYGVLQCYETDKGLKFVFVDINKKNIEEYQDNQDAIQGVISLKSIEEFKDRLQSLSTVGGRFKRKNYKNRFNSKSKYRIKMMTKKNKSIHVKSKKINIKCKCKVNSKSKSKQIHKKHKTKRRYLY
jgi:hypothetical protein